VLGTDGFGLQRQPRKPALLRGRSRWYIAQACDCRTAAEGKMSAKDVTRAIKTWKPDPRR
jgi:pyruvate dehydrogenase E1 component